VLPPTGPSYEIAAAGYAAVVTQGGAALRSLTYDGRDLVHGFAPDEMPHRCRGQLLAPWPNRIRDGRYEYAGSTHQLALSEPPLHNAIHGLVRWHPWMVVEQSHASITLVCRVLAQTGYPWALDLASVYTLGDDGLTVTQSATNQSSTTAPYGSGAHPFLTLPSGRVDAWTLHAPAATRLTADERLLPTGREPVAGTPYDFREPRAVGDLVLDHCFTDLARDESGVATVRLSETGGAVELWMDAAHPWLMLYSDDGAEGEPSRQGLAVEPMTAPVDAFNSGEDVRHLEPGETFSATWGIRAA
jgi:aldose 1-epimerase